MLSDATFQVVHRKKVDRILIRIPLPSPPLPERAPVPPPVEASFFRFEGTHQQTRKFFMVLLEYTERVETELAKDSFPAAKEKQRRRRGLRCSAYFD